MCGRYTLSNPEQLALRFDLAEAIVEARYNIAPTQQVPVIVASPGGRVLRHMRWGFRPAWAASTPGRPTPINARAEGLRERPFFRGALARHRCLIPADGFFEWQIQPDRQDKQPIYIRLRDGELVAFAGLYAEERDDRGTGAATCAIITTAPNSLMAPIHNRMPAILDPADEALWLDPEVSQPDAVLGCLHPYPNDALVAYPVPLAVSNPRHEGPHLISPLHDALAA